MDLYLSSFKFSRVFVPAESVILGCCWVFFWSELTIMLLILFKILISDDIQNDTSEIYATVFIEVLRNSRNWAKNLSYAQDFAK